MATVVEIGSGRSAHAAALKHLDTLVTGYARKDLAQAVAGYAERLFGQMATYKRHQGMLLHRNNPGWNNRDAKLLSAEESRELYRFIAEECAAEMDAHDALYREEHHVGVTTVDSLARVFGRAVDRLRDKIM